MAKRVEYLGDEFASKGRTYVVSVSRNEKHTFTKTIATEINLQKGLGVEGDAHCGKTVQHRSIVAVDPGRSNLRQVHLVQEELFKDLEKLGFIIKPGDIGENVTTSGVDLLSLPRGTILKIGETVKLEITGLRNPCSQLDEFKEGLMKAVLERGTDGSIIRKSGVMAIVLEGGKIIPGDQILVDLPPMPHEKLTVV